MATATATTRIDLHQLERKSIPSLSLPQIEPLTGHMNKTLHSINVDTKSPLSPSVSLLLIDSYPNWEGEGKRGKGLLMDEV